MKRLKVSVAIGAILASYAAMSAAAATALDSVKLGTYNVESYHTQVGFTLSHFGFTNYSGLFSGATGSLRLESRQPRCDPARYKRAGAVDPNDGSGAD